MLGIASQIPLLDASHRIYRETLGGHFQLSCCIVNDNVYKNLQFRAFGKFLKFFKLLQIITNALSNSPLDIFKYSLDHFSYIYLIHDKFYIFILVIHYLFPRGTNNWLC